MVWYSHLFQNFPQFIVIHTVKGFGTVNKAEIDVFLELSCIFHDPADVDGLGRSLGVGNGNLLRILAWKIPWAEEPVRLQSMGSQSVRHDLATEYTHTHTHPTRDSVFMDFMA